MTNITPDMTPEERLVAADEIRKQQAEDTFFSDLADYELSGWQGHNPLED